MGFNTNLLIGIAELLDASGVGAWSVTGAYNLTDTAITADVLPQKPDGAIALALYPVQDDGGTTDSIIGLQCRVRGQPGNRTTDKDILDGLFDTLHDLQNVTISGIPIVRIWHQSGARLGPDAANRLEHTANYYIQCTREAAHRSD
ncbi:minor capsid protein [Arthrobacter sp. GMC3]|uniref:phage tail terminator protein n=1 Tax=Arthrobacter sp. GMC3 TaxID=2058894 RepID=UPI000CE554C9|nr:minor capsid protein [Arthrobacter sp. GMC3]